MHRDLPEFKQPRFDLHKKRILEDEGTREASSGVDRQDQVMEKKAMYPFTVQAYDFKPGDWVQELLSDRYASAYMGKVLHILPKANKVVVKWPTRISQADPEWLVKVNKEQTALMVTSARKAVNLVRVAKSLRDKGLNEIQSLVKMKQALGHALPFGWLRGAVEVAYPKRTASYTADAQHIRTLVRIAADVVAVQKAIPQPKE